MEVLSSRGLCPDCAATDGTADPTPPIDLPVPLDSTPLPAAADSDPPPDTPTASFGGAAATGEPKPVDRPLLQSPAGYEVLERLGRGGMGEVYLAREQASERLVALKVLLNPGSPDAYERFLVELRVLAKLDHPSVVRVLSHDFLRTQPYFTMEYLPGGSLSRSGDGVKPLARDEAVRLIRVIAGAVAAAHAAGIIHRDLKPSNVLLDAAGAPRVADFGLAKRLDENDGLTATTGALGTPAYMPPEQVSRKNGAIGTWSDVYGLGATLYALLTDRAPFCGTTSVEVINQVLADPPPRLRAIRPEVPLALEAIVLKCLAKETKDRYQTVAELLADLNLYETGLRPVAPLMTRGRRLKLWAGRNRRGVVTAAALVFVVAGAFILGASNPQKSAPVDAPAPDPLRKMQDELVAGRPVTLISGTGLPAVARSVFEPTQLGASPLGDQTCSFHAFRHAMVELCPDPITEHYRVNLELRRIGLNAPRVGEDTDWLGFYFGYSSCATTGPAISHLMFAVKYKDYAPPVAPGRPPEPAAVYFQTLDFVQEPDRMLESEPSKLAALKIVPSPGNGKAPKWRPLSVEVSPARVCIQWKSDDEQTWLPLIEWSREKIETAYERRKRSLDQRCPGAGNVPRWHPRMPFGLIAFKSAVSVRNVVITPLP